jgi:hypothetical protein
MKIVVLSSHTSSLYWFRMEMMKEFVKRGHLVIALGPESEENWKSRFKVDGIEYRQLFVERHTGNYEHSLRKKNRIRFLHIKQKRLSMVA